MVNAVRAMLLAMGVSALAGCQTERVEHHKRPAFYYKAAMGDLPEEVRLEDGTVLKYSTYDEQGTVGTGKSDGRKKFQIREDFEDGTTILRALVPEHILVLFLVCLRDAEYELIWEQLLCEQTRQEFEATGGGEEGCTAFLKKHRHDLVATLTRMVAGLSANESRFDRLADGVIRCRLRPQHVGELKYKYFDVIQEGFGLKLLNMGG